MLAEKILLVDDDPNILDGYRRSLSREFLMETAQGGEPALALAAKNGPYAVVVSDMRMPGMDGIQLLSRIKALSPDTIRVMLTGNADTETAINAINEGNIFRSNGVYARVVDGRTLYVNTTQREQRIPIDGRHKGIISGREYDGTLILGPQDADLIP